MVVFADPLSEFHLTTPLYTIGHSNHTWESFSPLLLDNEIELLVDVRSNPVSRFAPFANHRTLPDLLESVDIDYEFMGGPLGGKPADKLMYDSKGKPDYHKMRSLDEFQEAIEQLATMATQQRTVVLCSEGDPTQCHRRLLLGPPSELAGCEILHITRDGNICKDRDLTTGKRHSKQQQGTLSL